MVEHCSPLIIRWRGDPEQVQNGRRRIHQADDLAYAFLATNQPRGRDKKRNVDIFIVQKKRVTVVPFVLPESFAVVAINNPNRVRVQPSRAKAVRERAKRNVLVVQCVAVLCDLVRSNERTAAVRSCVWMMSGNGKVGEKKTLAVRKSVDPREHPCNC